MSKVGLIGFVFSISLIAFNSSDGFANVASSRRPLPKGLLCGQTGTVESRISDCSKAEGSKITTSLGGQWILVSRYIEKEFGFSFMDPIRIRPFEVWKDLKTGLLWEILLNVVDRESA